MPTHSNAYKWLSSIAWEAFTGRLETATCCCFFLVECGIMQACIIDTVNILLSKCLVIVGSDTMLKPPSLPLKKSRFWRHWVSDMKCEESLNGWESRSLLSLPISSFSLCSPLGTHFFFLVCCKPLTHFMSSPEDKVLLLGNLREQPQSLWPEFHRNLLLDVLIRADSVEEKLSVN